MGMFMGMFMSIFMGMFRGMFMSMFMSMFMNILDTARIGGLSLSEPVRPGRTLHSSA